MWRRSRVRASGASVSSETVRRDSLSLSQAPGALVCPDAPGWSWHSSRRRPGTSRSVRKPRSVPMGAAVPDPQSVCWGHALLWPVVVSHLCGGQSWSQTGAGWFDGFHLAHRLPSPPGTRFSRTEKRMLDRHRVPVCCTCRHSCGCLRLASRSTGPVWEPLSASRPPQSCGAQPLSQEPSSALALQVDPQRAHCGPYPRLRPLLEVSSLLGFPGRTHGETLPEYLLGDRSWYVSFVLESPLDSMQNSQLTAFSFRKT